MTREEAVAIAYGHFQSGSIWLERIGDTPPARPGRPAEDAASATAASAHFAAGQLPLAIAAAEGYDQEGAQ